MSGLCDSSRYASHCELFCRQIPFCAMKASLLRAVNPMLPSPSVYQNLDVFIHAPYSEYHPVLITSYECHQKRVQATIDMKRHGIFAHRRPDLF